MVALEITTSSTNKFEQKNKNKKQKMQIFFRVWLQIVANTLNAENK